MTESVSRKMITFPDELLIKMINECVDPYSLQLHQQVYHTNDFSAATGLHGHHWLDQHNISLKQQSFTPNLIYPRMNHATTLLVNGFAKARSQIDKGDDSGLEYLSGLPDLVNLKLVNRMFYHETWSAIRTKFNAKVEIQDREQFFDESRSTDWDISRNVYIGQRLRWLKPMIIKVTLSLKFAKDIDAHIFDASKTPNLGTVVLQHPIGIVVPVRLRVTTTKYDRHTVRKLRENLNQRTLLNALRSRTDTKILVEVPVGPFDNLNAPEPAYVLLTVDVSIERKYTITHRRELGLAETYFERVTTWT